MKIYATPLPGTLAMVALLLAPSCTSIARENILAHTSRTIGGSVGQDPKTQTPKITAGVSSDSFFSVPTSKTIVDGSGEDGSDVYESDPSKTPQVVSAVDVSSSFKELFIGIDLKELFAVGEIAVNSKAATVMYITAGEKPDGEVADAAALAAGAANGDAARTRGAEAVRSANWMMLKRAHTGLEEIRDNPADYPNSSVAKASSLLIQLDGELGVLVGGRLDFTSYPPGLLQPAAGGNAAFKLFTKTPKATTIAATGFDRFEAYRDKLSQDWNNANTALDDRTAAIGPYDVKYLDGPTTHDNTAAVPLLELLLADQKELLNDLDAKWQESNAVRDTFAFFSSLYQ